MAGETSMGGSKRGFQATLWTVVLKAHASDPYRPQVRIVVDRQGRRLDLAYDVNLWEHDAKDGKPSAIKSPLDPAEHQIDPLALM